MTARYRANREVLYKGPYKIILCHVFTMPHRGGDSTIKINTIVKTGQQTIEKRSDAKGSRFNIT